MSKLTLVVAMSLLAPCLAEAQTSQRLLIGRIAVNRTHVAFALAGDLWVAGRDGGQATKLTSGPDEESFPAYSPDGSKLAFSRLSGGDWDVYVMRADGGEPVRLTDHPEDDLVAGWTPDGTRVLFQSTREEEEVFRLYTVPVVGGSASELPLPQAFAGSFSPDGARIAYTPMTSFGDWRHYRGGMQGVIWLATLAGGAVEPIPGASANDRYPMWVGSKIYFVSDRDGTHNLFAYDLGSKRVTQLTSHRSYGIRFAAATDDAVAYVQDGSVHLYEPNTRSARRLDVRVDLDAKELEPRIVNAARTIESVTLTSTADGVLFGARGEALALDPVTGTVRNLTETSGAAERYPAYSPDGKWVAYFTDASGEYELAFRPTEGGPVRAVSVEAKPTFYRELTWSPDSRRVAFSDHRLALWIADVESGTATRVDVSPYFFQEEYRPSWSPDGRWLAFSRHLENRVRTVFVYDTGEGRLRQVTDGITHTESPVFDASGRYLYFLSSPNAGTSEYGWGVLKGELMRPLVVRRAHALVLRKDGTAPTLPAGAPNPEATWAPVSQVQIDFDGLDRRVVDLALPTRDYAALAAGKPGVLFALVTKWPDAPGDFDTRPDQSLYRVELSKETKLDLFADDVTAFELARDGSRMIYAKGRDWALVDASKPPKPDEGRLDLKNLQVRVDPRAEWRQIYHEAWRLMRDWFYDPRHHGLDVAELERHYAEYLPAITRRSDINALMSLMLGHVSVSHLRVAGGDVPPPAGPPRRTGMLGADIIVEGGRYKFARVLRSTPYSSPMGSFAAPLDRPGVQVREGEYLLEVEGKRIDTSRSVYGYFEGTAGKPTRITVGPSADGAGARTVTVIPVSGENLLRRANWAERNRQLVEQMSGGRLGYVYVPDYGRGTMSAIRGLAGYSHRDGIIIDQRFNGGGITPDYLVEWLRQRPLYYYAFREGDDIATPVNTYTGTAVLIVNEHNGSAAETFAFMYKLGKVGTIVGKRTYGGGIGPSVFTPPFIDGGRAQIPNRAAYDPSGTSWGIENAGVAPDVEVDVLPSDLAKGRDPQLERAVRIALDRIASSPRVRPQRPKYPVHP